MNGRKEKEVKVKKLRVINKWKPDRIELVEKITVLEKQEMNMSEVAKMIHQMSKIFNQLESYDQAS